MAAQVLVGGSGLASGVGAVVGMAAQGGRVEEAVGEAGGPHEQLAAGQLGAIAGGSGPLAFVFNKFQRSLIGWGSLRGAAPPGLAGKPVKR